jgi:hypothetical protein
MKQPTAAQALLALSDRLDWAFEREYMVIDWLIVTSPDYLDDRRYITAKGRANGYRAAQREAFKTAMALLDAAL